MALHRIQLLARGDPLPEPALHHCGNLGFVCLVPCRCLRHVFHHFHHHHRTSWNVSLPRLHQLSWRFASFPSLLVLASTCRKTWGKDLISLGKRRQMLHVCMRGCTSLCERQQTSRGSQIELIRTRRFLEQVTHTTDLASSPVLTNDVSLSQETVPATAVDCLPAFPWLCRCACKQVGALRCGRGSNRTFDSQAHFCGKACAFLRVHPTFNTAASSSVSSGTFSARFAHAFALRTFNLAPWSGPATSKCVTHEGFRELPLQECGPLPCPVAAFGFGDLLSTHPRSSNCCQPNMTPCHDILHRRLQEATDVQACDRLGKQPGFAPVFGYMKVVQWEAQPVGLHKPARKDNVRGLSNRRVSTGLGNFTSLWFVERSSEPVPSSAIIRFCILEPLRSRRTCTWIGATHVFPQVSIGRPHPPVRTSPTLLRDAPRRAQQHSQI